ncbi:MAG: hypothetical protein K6G52_02645, partial [Treponemataceae bacterium]|nr:hypothetical protein [Treponemataceae bacterium]
MVDARKIQDAQVQNVIAWRDYLTTMNDSNFFDLMHMYLGEIQTPYNKQKLIEQLSSFLRKDEHKATIEMLLSENDILILNAVHFIPAATQQKIADFFKDSFSLFQVSDALKNFENRLLVFQTEGIYKINPLLQKNLEKYFDLSVLLENQGEINSTPNYSTGSICSSPLFLASIYSLVATNPSLCKLDGTFKKKFAESLPKIFPSLSDSDLILLLIKAAKRLGLFTQTENEILINRERWSSFSELSFLEQMIFLSVTSVAMFTLSSCQNYASQLYALLSSVPETGLTEKKLIKLGYLINEKNSVESSDSKNLRAPVGIRLSQILSAASSENEDDEEVKDAFELIIKNAIKFGLFTATAISDEDEKIYVPCDLMKEAQFSDQMPDVQLSIDANFSITVLGFKSLKSILPILDISEFVSYDSVMQLELTKKSCFRGFDNDMTSDSVKQLFQKYSMHSVPQNMLFSIDEWYGIFKSAQVYQGFVLQVAEPKRRLVEGNSEFSRHIKKILADGIYLLDFNNSDEFNLAVEKSGLDFISGIFPKAKVSAQLPMRKVPKNEDLIFQLNQDFSVPKNFENASQHQKSMSELLYKMDATKEQKLSLQERINQKIIVDTVQLSPASVRLVKSEAFGMDYSGKIHVLEKAIENHALVELTYDEKYSENGIKYYTVLP